VLDTVVQILMLLGLVIFTGTTVGLIRFPDFYCRVHAAGKGDTLSTVLMLSGLALYNLHHFSLDNLLVSAKILLIVVFIFIASPTATHAIIDAGYEAGVRHWTKRKKPTTPWEGEERRKRDRTI